MCLYPTLRINRKWIPNKKNGGNAPEIKDPRTKWIATGCGNCMECRKQKARAWSVRLQEEIRTDRTGKFVTLTFSNESIYELNKEIKNLDGYERDNEIATLAVRRFLERWRKKNGVSVKHWLITELGQPENKKGHRGTENIHLHGIIFSNEVEEIKKKWGYGFVYIGDYVSNRTINYCVKYSTKVDATHTLYKAKILTSKGIGSKYLNRSESKRNEYQENGETREDYRTETGAKIPMPTYYRNKIYTEEQRENLWIQKLDKGERWVDGVKAKDIDEYYKILKIAQEKNERLGYGKNEVDWDKKRYENDRRNANFKKRIEKFENNGDNE